MAKKYVKPEVTQKGQTKEPVEAGCCLRSCGGSPAPSKKGTDSALSVIRSAKKS